MSELLEVKDLHISFTTKDNLIQAVDNISFSLHQGEILGIVGESGSGKSVTALSILRLLSSNANIDKGSVLFKGENLLSKSNEVMRHIRGNEISMIFQDPMTSLNPLFSIGKQINDVIRRHQNVSYKKAKIMVIDNLKDVGVPQPAKRYNSYPHEFSGGMRQRVMIAMALACHPDLLIADEPTTALDVSTQSEILKLLLKMKEELGASIMLITHDLGVVANMCSRVIVMRKGSIVESGSVEQIFNEPQHPYTIELLNSLPSVLNAKENFTIKKSQSVVGTEEG